MKWLFVGTLGLVLMLLSGLLPVLAGVGLWPQWGEKLVGTVVPPTASPRAFPLRPAEGGGRPKRPRFRRRRRKRSARSAGRPVILVREYNELTHRRRVDNDMPLVKPSRGTSGAAKTALERASASPEPLAQASLRAWVVRELDQVRLGDTRRDRRLQLLVEQLAQQPTASIPKACGSAGAAKAAYRFFDNRRVQHETILAGHRQACLQRIAPERLLLVLQDTTSLNYSAFPTTEGLGPLGSGKAQGLFVHSALATSPAGVPLGLLDQQVWARDPAKKGSRHQRRKRPIEEKESFKWLRGLRATLEGLPQSVCVVTVADREADVFDLFWDAHQRGAQLLVRSSWNRSLTGEQRYLWEEVARSPVQGRFTVEVGRAGNRLPRQATVEVRFMSVEIKPPRYRRAEKGLFPLPLTAIDVRELNPPSEQDGVHWLLLTNRPVADFAQAQRYVRWYSLRWLIERYHFVLKSGCKIEQRQLGTAERLKRCLAVYAIVAWRLLWLTYQARVTPTAPCTVALETHEWQALYCYIHKTPTPPAEPPSLNQAVRWIAQLGGFLGRKGDGEPGVKVLWRGWQSLHYIAETWLITHPPPDVGNA